MQTYLVQLSYTGEAWRAWVHDPHDCSEKVQATVRKLGGNLVGMWWALGQHDAVVLVEMPDEESFTAFNAFTASMGGFAEVRVTPLLDNGRAIAALRRAAEL